MSRVLTDRRPSILLSCLVVAPLWLLAAGPTRADERDEGQVGRQPDERIVVPTNQVLSPSGRQVTFPGRPVDLALVDGGRTLVVKNMADLVFIDVETARVVETLAIDPGYDPGRGVNIDEFTKHPIAPNGKGRPPYPLGFSVVGLVADGGRIYASDSQDRVRVARRRPDGRHAWERSLLLDAPRVGGSPFPTGLARQGDGGLWVASSRGNNVQRIDPTTGRVDATVPVGVAPYMVVVAGHGRLYVSNWGGDPPAPGMPQADSSGTSVRIDPKTGVADQGTVSVVGVREGRWEQLRTIQVGLHPSGMALSPRGTFVYVANANSDTVSVIDTRTDTVVETIACRPEARLPFGSGANAVAVGQDGGTLYVANGTNNAIAVVRLGAGSADLADARAAAPARSVLAGLIPTAWYPGAVVLSPDGKTLLVANVKGVGSLSQPRPVDQGKNTHDFLGSVSIIDVPDAGRLAEMTREVSANNRLAYSLAGLDPPRPDARPLPVPERHGEPSVFEHVVYVIKENRSYDQILGDMKEGNGDPSLVLYGEDVTPNQHALARQFTLFDNFYCSGALSATGHQWVSEAYVVDYLEKTFGEFTRSYPVDGDDPLAFASSGFLWDNALGHGKTFRNFGEFCSSTFTPATVTWTDLYDDSRNGTRRVKVDVVPNVATLKPYTHPHYPGFPLIAPDVYRAAIFIEELKRYEEDGSLPNLTYVFLPCDHTMGTRPGAPTPRAMLADNDLALGRIVEAVSHSRFWPKTCVFVVEDDPQFGFDHVDGHRTVVQAISPYTRRRHVDHVNANQTGLVKTIELILGLPPMNQLDLSATPLRACFQATPDPTPYKAVPNRVPLDEMNPPLVALQGQARYWAEKSIALDLDDADEADEDTFNRILWFAAHGDAPYPVRFVGTRGD